MGQSSNVQIRVEAPVSAKEVHLKESQLQLLLQEMKIFLRMLI